MLYIEIIRATDILSDTLKNERAHILKGRICAL